MNGIKDQGRRAYKFVTLSLVGKSMPIVLAFEPVIESSEWDENLSHRYHQTVRQLVKRAQEFANIDLVLADRGSSHSTSTRPWRISASITSSRRSSGRTNSRLPIA